MFFLKKSIQTVPSFCTLRVGISHRSRNWTECLGLQYRNPNPLAAGESSLPGKLRLILQDPAPFTCLGPALTQGHMTHLLSSLTKGLCAPNSAVHHDIRSTPRGVHLHNWQGQKGSHSRTLQWGFNTEMLCRETATASFSTLWGWDSWELVHLPQSATDLWQQEICCSQLYCLLPKENTVHKKKAQQMFVNT